MSAHTAASGKGGWLIVASAMLWGTTGTSQALAPDGSSPQTIGAVRLLVGGLFLTLLALSRGGLRRQVWPVGLTFLAGFFVAAYQLCFFWGVSRTGVAIGTIVGIGSSPVFLTSSSRRGKQDGAGWFQLVWHCLAARC